jgi:hypothetical protein
MLTELGLGSGGPGYGPSWAGLGCPSPNTCHSSRLALWCWRAGKGSRPRARLMVDHVAWVHGPQARSTVDRVHSLSLPSAYGALGAHGSRRGHDGSCSFLVLALSPAVSSLALALQWFSEAARGIYGIVGLRGTC